MQRDHLEQFIFDKREAFDDATPSLQVWGEVGKELDRQNARRLSFWRVTRVAAAVIALLACGALLGGYFTAGKGQLQVASLEEVAPQYAELEEYYQEQIQQKSRQLAAYQPGASLEHDLQQLDAVMQELRRELLVAPKGKEEEIVRSLMESYQAKVRILERVLNRMQSTAPKEDKTNEDEQVSI